MYSQNLSARSCERGALACRLGQRFCLRQRCPPDTRAPLYPREKRGDLKMRERTKQINFRVYPTEAEVIKRKARKCGLSISDYVRNCALERKIAELPKEALGEAYRIIGAVRMQLSDYGGTEKYTGSLEKAQEILLDIYRGKEVNANGGDEDMAG